MKLLNAIEKRTSVRAFDKSKKISKAQVNAIIKAGCLAPSARNTQPWRFLIAETSEAKNKVMEAMSSHNDWANEAPVLLVLMADKNSANKPEENKHYIDIGLCLENLLLETVNQGLAGCACAAFDKEMLSGLLRLPEKLEPLIIIPIGFEAKGNAFKKLREKYGCNIERREHREKSKSFEECVFKRE